MNGLLLLAAGAAGVGVVHTLLGPDHYLPFVVLSRARGWSWRRTAAITLACGGAHVLSSVVLGFVGIGLGIALTRLTHIESVRGELAAWGLIAVGALYTAWGLRRALRGERHVHLHPHPLAHAHGHDPAVPHHHHHHLAAGEPDVAPAPRPAGLDVALEPGAAGEGARALTPWMLFIVFVLGPCEPLIPMLMVPAAAGSPWGVALVAVVFGLATLAAMLAAVWVGHAGARALPLGRLERYTHALAGFAILVSGLGIALLGW
jgi:hypothetical protein